MSPVRRIVTLLLVASLGGSSAVAFSACGEDDVIGGDADENVEVSLTERDLSPGRVEVTAGEIEFVVRNNGDRLHAFAVDTPDGTERTDDIKPGETERVTVSLSDGEYRMYDPRGGYRARGVSGTVVVGSGGTDTVTERTVTEEETVEAPPVEDPTQTETETQVQPPPPPPPPPAPTVTKEVPTEPPPMTTPTSP
jgi:hypothetical protein